MKKEIEFLKFIGAISIVCYHYYVGPLTSEINRIPFRRIQVLFIFGGVAVGMFFLISGFMIANKYCESMKAIGAKEFIVKRVDKLLPDYIMSNLLAYLCFQVFFRGGQDLKFNLVRFIEVITLNHYGFYQVESFPYNAATWYVGTLMLLYVIYAAIAMIYLDKKYTYITCSSVLCLMGYILIKGNYNFPLLYINMARGYFSFFLGVILSEIYKITNLNFKNIRRIAAGTIIVICSLCLAFDTADVCGDISLFGRLFAVPTLFVFTYDNSFIRYFADRKIFSYIFSLSFPIFFTHQIVIILIKRISDASGNMIDFSKKSTFVCILLMCMVVAVIWKEIVDKHSIPFLKNKSKQYFLKN